MNAPGDGPGGKLQGLSSWTLGICDGRDPQRNVQVSPAFTRR